MNDARVMDGVTAVMDLNSVMDAYRRRVRRVAMAGAPNVMIVSSGRPSGAEAIPYSAPHDTEPPVGALVTLALRRDDNLPAE